MNPTILASSVWYAGSGTVPHRLVLLKWSDTKFSVHSQSPDESFAEGHYSRSFEMAAVRWHAAVQRKSMLDIEVAATAR